MQPCFVSAGLLFCSLFNFFSHYIYEYYGRIYDSLSLSTPLSSFFQGAPKVILLSSILQDNKDVPALFGKPDTPFGNQVIPFLKLETPLGKPGPIRETGHRNRETGYPFQETGDDRYFRFLAISG